MSDTYNNKIKILNWNQNKQTNEQWYQIGSTQRFVPLDFKTTFWLAIPNKIYF